MNYFLWGNFQDTQYNQEFSVTDDLVRMIGYIWVDFINVLTPVTHSQTSHTAQIQFVSDLPAFTQQNIHKNKFHFYNKSMLSALSGLQLILHLEIP